MPEFNLDFIKTYPLVWTRLNGKKVFQVHGIVARKLSIKKAVTALVEVSEDLVKIRKMLHIWKSQVLRPEYVLTAPVEEGDVQMWDSWGVFHTDVDYSAHYGARTMQQANLGASDRPRDPRLIRVF